MPLTPCSRTWSAWRNASSIEMLRSDSEQPVVRDDDEGVDLGAQRVDARSACTPRRLPSKPNGRVTTPMVSAPSRRAIFATTGRATGAGATALAGGYEHHVGAL